MPVVLLPATDIGRSHADSSDDVRRRLPAKYPRVAPTIALEDSKGLSKADLSSLSSALKATVATMLGERMVDVLVSEASAFITDKHSNMEKGKQTSLEDQRRLRAEKENKVGSPVCARREELCRSFDCC